VLGILFGFLLGAGVALAAIYVYDSQTPVTIRVAAIPDQTTQPGLEVTPSSLDFGEVVPTQRTAGTASEKRALTIKNVSSYTIKGIQLEFTMSPCVALQLRDDAATGGGGGYGGGDPCTQFLYYQCTLAPGESVTIQPYFVVFFNTPPGTYQFTFRIRAREIL
jgi:hypothetical protein